MKAGLTKSIVSPQNLRRSNQRKRLWKSCSKAKMVGVSGIEPAKSHSQTQKHRFFTSFCVLFRAFSSETRAFLYRKVHNSHVVQTCKWSRLWSDLKLHITRPTSHVPQAPNRGGFFLKSLYHKSADISSPLTDQKVIRCNQRLRPSEPRTHDSKIPNHDLPNHDLPNRT